MLFRSNASGFAELSFRKEDDVVALEVRGVGKRFANDTNSQFAPAYQIMGIRWQRSNLFGPNRMTLLFRADNLFNRRYVGSLIVNNLSPFEPSPGRTAWLGVRAHLAAL